MIRKVIVAAIASLAMMSAVSATTYTASTASDITTNVSNLVAGDSLVISSGTYSITHRVDLGAVGTASNRIFFGTVGSNRAILNFNGQDTSDTSQGLYIYGNYWYVRGLDITKTGDNGILIENPPDPIGSTNYSDQGLGSYNIIEWCSTYRCNDAGMQIKRYGAFNKFINCDSYHNWDSKASGGNADGFSPKMGPGDTYFFGCRSWNNSDDGWDGYLKKAQCIKNMTTICEYCICYANGYPDEGKAAGNGNGFKMGSDPDDAGDWTQTWINRHCLAVGNLSKGFDQNGNAGPMTMINCSANNNGKSDYYIAEACDALTLTNCAAISGSTDLYSNAVETNCNYSATTSDFDNVTASNLIAARSSDGSLSDATLSYMRAKSSSTLYTKKQGWMLAGEVPTSDSLKGITAILPMSDFRATTKAGSLIGGASSVRPNVTKVNFTALTSGKLSVAVCDISGKKVMDINNNFSAGNQSQNIDLSNVSSGMYVCNFKYTGSDGVKTDNLKLVKE